MKKLLAISLIAMTAVTAANAEIASKAYVDQERDVAKAYTDTKIGNIDGADVAAAIAAAVQGGTENAVTRSGSDAVGSATVPVYVNASGVVTPTTLGTMALETAADYTKTGLDTTYAKQSDFTTLQNAVNDNSTGLAATKAIADAALPSTTAASTYQTLANISTNMTTDTGSDTKYPSVKAVETAISSVNSTASGLDTRLTAAEGSITTLTGSGAGSVSKAEADAKAYADSLVTDMETQTHAAATYQTLGNLATSTSWATDKSSDTKYASAKAVDTAITAVSGDVSGLDTRMTAAEGSITTLTGSGAGSVSKAEADAKAYADSLVTDMETQTHAAATYQTLGNLATSTSWATDKSSDTKYASAKAVDAAITAAAYDDTALAGRVSANETAIGDANSGLTKGVADNASAIAAINNATTGILATAESYTDTQLASYTPTSGLGDLAVKDTVGTDDIDANAVTLAKLSATLPSGCQASGAECVLKSSNGALAWEVIQRATGE